MAPLEAALHLARDTLLAPRKTGGGFRGGFYGGGGGGGEDDEEGLSRGEIAGIVIGCLAFVALMGLIAYCAVRKRRSRKRARHQPAAKMLGRESGESEWRGAGPHAPPPAYMQQPARRWTGPWGNKQKRSPSYWMERRDEQEAGVVR